MTPRWRRVVVAALLAIVVAIALVLIDVTLGLALAAGGSWGIGFGLAHFVANRYPDSFGGERWDDVRWRSLGVVLVSIAAGGGVLAIPVSLQSRIGIAALLVGVSLVSYCIGAMEVLERDTSTRPSTTAEPDPVTSTE